MSWFRRLTGIQALINEQKITNMHLSELVQLNTPKKKPQGPSVKS